MFVFLKTSVNNKINHSLNEQESSCLKRNYSISFDFNGEFSDMPESKSPNFDLLTQRQTDGHSLLSLEEKRIRQLNSGILL